VRLQRIEISYSMVMRYLFRLRLAVAPCSGRRADDRRRWH